jgi:2-phosphosulfolactate phosphatase
MSGSVFVHLLPQLCRPGELQGSVAVVVDVLRATSVIVQALHAGAECVIPCLEIEDALQLAARSQRDRYLLAGERQGLPIPEFHLGNSPGDFSVERCRGRAIIMTTTNGTRAIHACVHADQVLIAAFTNRAALADRLLAESRPIHIVCAGTDGQVSWEDTLLAGSLIRALCRRETPCPELGNDSARIALALVESIDQNQDVDWESVLGEGRGGQRVREIGLGRDLAAAARMDQTDIIPCVVQSGAEYRVVPLPRATPR